MYLCKRRPSLPGACGGIVILVSNLDAKVNEEVVAFLNDKRRAQALLDTHKLDTPEMAAIEPDTPNWRMTSSPLSGQPFVPLRASRGFHGTLLGATDRDRAGAGAATAARAIVNRDAQPLREALGQNGRSRNGKLGP